MDDDLVRNVRRVKTPRELECIREGAQILNPALDRLMGALISGKSEAEAAAEAIYEIARTRGKLPQDLLHSRRHDRYHVSRFPQRLQPRHTRPRRPRSRVHHRSDLSGILLRPRAERSSQETVPIAHNVSSSRVARRSSTRSEPRFAPECSSKTRRRSAMNSCANSVPKKEGSAQDIPSMVTPTAFYFEAPPYISNTFRPLGRPVRGRHGARCGGFCATQGCG